MGENLRAMRGATWARVAAVLQEWAKVSGRAMWIDEACLPIMPVRQGLCELRGLDPLFVANAGTYLVAVAADRIGDCLSGLRERLQLDNLR